MCAPKGSKTILELFGPKVVPGKTQPDDGGISEIPPGQKSPDTAQEEDSDMFTISPRQKSPEVSNDSTVPGEAWERLLQTRSRMKRWMYVKKNPCWAQVLA